MEKFCYLGGTIGARGGADYIVITRTRSEGSKFSNLVPLVTWFALKGKKCIIFYMCLWCHASWKRDSASSSEIED